MIRKATINDLDALVNIEKECFPKDFYTKEQMLYELTKNPFANILVYEEKNIIKGFIIYMITFNSSTIVQIATSKIFRKQKIATSLIRAFNKELENLGYGEVETITLEVRRSNDIAHNFYLKEKFKDIVIKPKYYKDNEDAIYMMKVIL